MTRSVSFAAGTQEPAEEVVGNVGDPSRSKGGSGSSSGKPANGPSSSSSLFCPNCGSKAIDHHEASGESICTVCGVVVEENAIVSSVEFVEGAGGASSMVGQFVSATSSKAYTGGRGGRYGFSRDSRETTLANGRRRIQDVASRLRLGTHFVDAAHRFFTIAVEKNFVQGRRTTHVVAACLYIACRQEKSQHMLIDFSDALQVNVYTLGTCFLKFRRLLGLSLEIIDPALYVYRFASHLDLDEKANAVALTALRLVSRMKRDWIVAGRRPAGICAAALLIAARAHGFTRHNHDVTRILRVCGLTVSNRVREFELTPSASLTLNQFSSIDLETEADPPVFTKNRIREARARAIQANNTELLTSGALDNPHEGRHQMAWRKTGRKQKNQTDHNQLYTELESQLEEELRNGPEQPVANKTLAETGEDGEDDHEDDGGEGTENTENIAFAGSNEGVDDVSATDGTEPASAGSNVEKVDAQTKKTDEGDDPTTATGNVAGLPSVVLKTNGGSATQTTTDDTCVGGGRDNDNNDDDKDNGTTQDTQNEVATGQGEAVEGGGTTTKDNGGTAQLVLRSGNNLTVPSVELAKMYPTTKDGRAIILPEEATPEELEKSRQAEEDKLDLAAWKEDMPEEHMESIEELFRTDEEVAQKEAIFNKLNKDYLVQQERKESVRLRDEEAAKNKEQDELAQAEGHARYVKSRSGRRRKRTEGDNTQTTEEALLEAVSNRKISRKINYDAMSAIFDDGGGFSTDILNGEDGQETQAGTKEPGVNDQDKPDGQNEEPFGQQEEEEDEDEDMADFAIV